MANEGAAEPALYVGLMSGTSFDGIDAALLTTDGQSQIDAGPACATEYDKPFRERLRAVMGKRQAPPDLIADLTDRHADCVATLLAENNIASDQVTAVGFHGQTIFHDPANRLTVQIGDPARLADRTAIDVVADFRLADVAAGGEGAPIAPIYHKALLAGRPLPAVMVNIGGVANVTWTDGERLLAFDCGPGNAPIDDFLRANNGPSYDDGGNLGLAGAIDDAAVTSFLDQPYFARIPPKSLDRNELTLPDLGHTSIAVGAATLAAICVSGITAATRWFPAPATRWIVSGGGRLNGAIMAGLRKNISALVIAAEDAGIDGGNLEAHMIAYLVARSNAGLPLTFPGTTGVDAPQTGGRHYSAGSTKSRAGSVALSSAAARAVVAR